MSFGSLAKHTFTASSGENLMFSTAQRFPEVMQLKAVVAVQCLSLMLDMELRLKGDLMSGRMVKGRTQLQDIFILPLYMRQFMHTVLIT